MADVTPRIAWTPIVTCLTPGDLSVTYNNRTAFWGGAGSIITLGYDFTFVPTYTTASGALCIQGLPLLPPDNAIWEGSLRFISPFTWPAGVSQLVVSYALNPAPGNIVLTGLGTGIGGTGINITAFPTGFGYRIAGSFTFLQLP